MCKTTIKLLILSLGLFYFGLSLASPHHKIIKGPVTSEINSLKFNDNFSLSIKPQVFQIAKNFPSYTNIMAMWSTPIPNLTLGYSVASFNNSSPSLSTNSTNYYNTLTLQYTGF
jgi:hypothetical protein